MKKQIFILTFLVLALIAGTSNLFGQTAVHNSNPEAAVSCTNDALHPIAGTPYEYSVTTDPTGGTYTWWATTNTSFISGGVLNNSGAGTLASPDVTATTAANYNQGTAASTIELSWGTDVLAAAAATPTFVAVYYEAPAGSCSDNLKVYQIEPINAFTVDILSLDPTTLAADASGYSYAAAQCFDNVQSASWSGDAMTYDYGTNTLYFEIVAANFTEEWTPTFTLTGLQGAQTATIEWDYDTSFGSAVAVTSGTASGTTAKTSATDTSTGVSIYAKVTITNSTFEGIDDTPITLAVNGTNTAGQPDVVAADCTSPDTNEATQTLTERPEVIDNTDVGDFEQP
ncbi:hypothetical protein ACUNWD_20370 [Sunxiuqinia sp. A32]|uniref:hypothetical protein n=1 Tax=Sunxiuqinia sp. A32 TaxID=3461496 RepID=UPI004045B57D